MQQHNLYRIFAIEISCRKHLLQAVVALPRGPGVVASKSRFPDDRKESWVAAQDIKSGGSGNQIKTFVLFLERECGCGDFLFSG